MRNVTLWHGTSTGEGHTVLSDVFNGGLLASKADLDRSGQKPGVYCCFSQGTAEVYARAASRHKGGDPLLVRIETELDARTWDIDHEMSAASMKLLSGFRQALAAVAPGEIDISFSNWGGGREEKVTSIRCTEEHLVLSVETGGSKQLPERSVPQTYKIPWKGEYEVEEMVAAGEAVSGASMTTRLQALHDYLRRVLKDDYILRLQDTLDRAEEEHLHVKYVGSGNLIPAEFLGQLAEFSGSMTFVKVDPASSYREQVIEGIRNNKPIPPPKF